MRPNTLNLSLYTVTHLPGREDEDVIIIKEEAVLGVWKRFWNVRFADFPDGWGLFETIFKRSV